MNNQEKNLIVKMAIKRERDRLLKALEINKEARCEGFQEEINILNLELTNSVSVLDEAININLFPEVDVDVIKNNKYVKGGVKKC